MLIRLSSTASGSAMAVFSFARTRVSFYQEGGKTGTDTMTAQNRLLDELAKFMTDAAGRARRAAGGHDAGARQAERLVSDMDLVNRDAFEAVRAMAIKAARGKTRHSKSASRSWKRLWRSSRPRPERAGYPR